MADDTNILPKDQNYIRAVGFESDTTPGLVLAGQIDEATGRILVDNAGGGAGTGTVTSVSVVTANGVSGSVATATTTPAITLTLGAITPTSVNGITLSGSGSLANSGTSSLTGFTGSGTSSGTNTGDQTTITGNAGTATALQNTRTIWGQNFNGTANVTGTLALGTADLTLTGSIGSTGARATKVWTAALESTAMPTVGGTAILTSLTAPQFTTIELGHASDTTLARVSAGVASIEGSQITTMNTTSLAGNQTANLSVKTRYLLDVGLYETQNLTLPSTFAVGDEIEIVVDNDSNAGVVNIILSASDNFLYVGDTGTLTSSTSNLVFNQNASLTLVCIVANTTWRIVKMTGARVSINSVEFASVANVLTGDNTKTVTNKRIQDRISSATSGDITPDLSVANMYQRTNLSGTTAINAPTGSPVNGEELLFRLRSTSIRTLTWNATYVPIGVTIPTATVANKLIYVKCIFNSTQNQWDVIQVNNEV